MGEVYCADDLRLGQSISWATPPLSSRCFRFYALEEYRADPDVDRRLIELYGR